ncbi:MULTISPECIES: hypothetical protein [Alphaproteobacteria]|uniref:Uncharacterized protein n=2 Tax=Alphaproteobacteria TaxID=28211 RepID=A0A512HEJ0_9HYPH|nr:MULTISPECIES: hypothetical protein [Alphaproteobacteria]GEO83857.1 hypothetical protein RNA01_07890 [Ciceribacter naphthalenivorans]GLR21265.1 hypothetical protein GCM10007920_10510 [Ciceribacter naphthalenivorans]GLT04121.1 hypothetical protein GCM10007926_10510 [Sphingomonas psychrolutea]
MNKEIPIEQAILKDTRAIRRLLEADEAAKGPELLISLQEKMLEAIEQTQAQITQMHQLLSSSRRNPTISSRE